MQSTILVVDDEADLRRLTAMVLESEGHTVVTAADGVDALELIRNGLTPELVLTDLMMPRMSGWELRNELLRDPDLCKIPVLLTTGYMRNVPRESKGEVLQKPVELDLLLSRVEELLKAA